MEDAREWTATRRQRSNEEREAIVGKRISVLWPGPGEWFAGKVHEYAGDSRTLPDHKRNHHFVKYDIGEGRWEKLFGRPGDKVEWKPITTGPFG